jgi:hypothetical protein
MKRFALWTLAVSLSAVGFVCLGGCDLPAGFVSGVCDKEHVETADTSALVEELIGRGFDELEGLFTE